MGIIIIAAGALMISVGIILFATAAFRENIFLKTPGAILLLAGAALIIYGWKQPGGEKAGKILEKFASPAAQGDYDLTGAMEGYAPDPVFAGDEVAFAFGIDNKGTSKVPAGGYVVKFYVNDNFVWSEESTTAVHPGRSGKGCMVDFKAEKPGQYTYKLEIVPLHGLTDTNMANNIITGTFLVQESRRN